MAHTTSFFLGCACELWVNCIKRQPVNTCLWIYILPAIYHLPPDIDFVETGMFYQAWKVSPICQSRDGPYVLDSLIWVVESLKDIICLPISRALRKLSCGNSGSYSFISNIYFCTY